MRLFSKPIALLGLLASASTLMPQQADAVPAFARQTGMACVSCHAQNFPALNAFGRTFRAQGYTMRGAAPLIEGDELSLPADLKASLITKLRYHVSEEVDGGRGEIQWPDEAALLMGGRAAENIGFLLEAGIGPQEAEVGLEADGADGSVPDGTLSQSELDAFLIGGHAGGESIGNFLSFKVHTNVTDNFGLVLFGTDGLGVGYGMELMNTGAQRSQRPIENRSGFSAYQRLGTASGTATGLAFVYHTNNLMVNYSHWAPSWGNVNANLLGGLANYLRLNYFINAGGWDLGLGASYMGGTVEVGATDPATELTVDGTGVDFQALGELGTVPVEIYLSYGTAPHDNSNPNSIFNSGDKDKTAYAVLGKLGVADRTSLYVGHGSDDDGYTTTTDTTVGVQYMLAQNAKLELYNVSTDVIGGDYTMLMLFAGF